jgi:hypothetical protein
MAGAPHHDRGGDGGDVLSVEPLGGRFAFAS